mgnify:CR=1 FL=1
MTSGDELRWLKAISREFLDGFWKTDLYNDVKDNIMFRDGKRRSQPRTEEERKALHDEIDQVMEDLADEIVEALKDKGIRSPEDVRDNGEVVREIIYQQFGAFRRRAWELVKSEFPSKGV